MSGYISNRVSTIVKTLSLSLLFLKLSKLRWRMYLEVNDKNSSNSSSIRTFYATTGVPVAQPVAIGVPHPVAVGVPQPFPVHVPVAKPVAIPVVKTVAIPVEKKVPFPVEKVIPVPVEKHVPITVEKHIPVPVEKPYPIHVPVYKHVFHRVKSHGYGWTH